MKALRLAAILLAFGGAATFMPQAAQAQVNQLGAELNIIPDKVTPTADGIRMVREAGADNAVLTLQAFEALKTVADGQATKIIIPSDIQGVAGLAASLKEIVVDK